MGVQSQGFDYLLKTLTYLLCDYLLHSEPQIWMRGLLEYLETSKQRWNSFEASTSRRDTLTSLAEISSSATL